MVRPQEEIKQVCEKDEAAQVMPESNQIPKAPKAGYKVRPDMADLARMTLTQLQKVSMFKVWNEFGSIEFTGETDVTGVDLADVITIA